MRERKIHNYKSKILIEETIEKYGYHPDKLGRTSTKFIVCLCRFCGKPSNIRKGFYNKSGSACHKQCKLQEQSQCGSPFADERIREKAKKTNLERCSPEKALSLLAIICELIDGVKEDRILFRTAFFATFVKTLKSSGRGKSGPLIPTCV